MNFLDFPSEDRLQDESIQESPTGVEEQPFLILLLAGPGGARSSLIPRSSLDLKWAGLDLPYS
jgi:hypothetical protein